MLKNKHIMGNDFLSTIEAEIEKRAKEMAEKMLRDMHPQPTPSDIAPNGEVITPFLVGGKKFLTCSQTEALTGVKYPALWRWKKEGKLNYRKVGGRLLFLYDDVQRIITD